ncbi:hypothetical protein OUZ56_003259 [Daphnia magna]|uniref:Uncharacterized protein n=1 Tax=Daphnia magna TaxID=35525 RepID=A0ABR0A871_9CRUS|nr:hypothetical protein OUZ56_003259 [Daphnia magna]
MDEESEGESGSEDESDLGSTNTNSDVRLPLKVARVQDDSQSCEEVSQHKSPSKKVKMGSHSFNDELFYSSSNIQLFAGQS